MLISRHLALALCLVAASTGTLPAQVDGIAGKWSFVLRTTDISVDFAAELQADGEKVTGTFGEASVEGTFKEGNLALSFPFLSPETGVTDTLNIMGRLEREALNGEWSWGEYSGTFDATRPN
jgi:hypothetical protein